MKAANITCLNCGHIMPITTEAPTVCEACYIPLDRHTSRRTHSDAEITVDEPPTSQPLENYCWNCGRTLPGGLVQSCPHCDIPILHNNLQNHVHHLKIA